MRTLSSTLLAAQRSTARLPHLKVEIAERVAGVARLAWSRLYTGTEADFYHAATLPSDGSLIRARVAPADNQLYLQRVVNPGPGSNFGSWTALGTVSGVSGIALCSRGSTVLLFYVGTDQLTIYLRESTDSGATFGSPTVVVTAAAAVGWLAAAINPSNVVALFYSVGATVYAIKRTGGTWGTPQAWTNSVSSISGLACVHQSDWDLVITGQDSSNAYKVWTSVYGDGYSEPIGQWSTLAELALADAGSGMEFRCPFLAIAEVFRLFVVEKYTGTTAYSRPLWSHSLPAADFIDNLWREPVPFDLSSTYGVAIAYQGSYLWLSTPNGVWRAPITPASLEVTSDVISAIAEVGEATDSLRLELRNDDGRYNSLGAGANAAIKEGSQISLSLGYRTIVGVEIISGPACWIEGWEYITERGRSRLVLHGYGPWGLLARWIARRQFTWAAGARNLFNLLRFALARAGLELSSFSTSSSATGLYPAFAIHPRESGASAARRLLAMVPDVLLFRESVGYLKYPQTADVTDYSYGTNHLILQGHYGASALRANRIQVYGDGVMGETFSWGGVERVYDRLRQVHDLNLTTASTVQDRANAELQEEQRRAFSEEITVPTNCGQELYDIVEVTDAKAGLAAARRRILEMSLRYARQRGLTYYEQRLSLGGV